MTYIAYAIAVTSGFWAVLILLAALFARVERRLQEHETAALGPEQSNVTRIDFQNGVRVVRKAASR